MCHTETMYFLIRVSYISVLVMIQVHHHMMLAAVGTSTRFGKAGGAQRRKPANPSCKGRSGKPKKAHVNTSSCPSSSLVRINFLSSLMQPYSYSLTKFYNILGMLISLNECNGALPYSKWLPLFLMLLFKVPTVCALNYTVYCAVL